MFEEKFLEMKMASAKQASDGELKGTVVAAEKRVILSMGGKGGVGKTSLMTMLAEWFAANEIPVKLMDLDSENKARGSLTHFFGGGVPKVNACGTGFVRRPTFRRSTSDSCRYGSGRRPSHLRLV